jgi:hypothetical protein
MNLFHYQDPQTGETEGPVTPQVIQQMLMAGQLHLDSLVLRSGDEEWQPLGALEKEFKAAGPKQEPDAASMAAEAASGMNFKMEPIYETRGLGLFFLWLGFMLMLYFMLVYNVRFSESSYDEKMFRLDKVADLDVISTRACGVTAGGFLSVVGAVLMTAGASHRIREVTKS